MDYIKELQLRNIDTICIYKDYYLGYDKFVNYQEDSITYICFQPISSYILWIEQKKTFLKKIDNCFDYSIIRLDSISLWKIFFSYKNLIKKEKVKPFEYLVYKNKKKEIGVISIDHSRYLDFKFIIDKDTISMEFDEFDLQKHNGSKYNNINYLYNQRLKSKKIIDELERLVLHIEEEKLFIKSKR